MLTKNKDDEIYKLMRSLYLKKLFYYMLEYIIIVMVALSSLYVKLFPIEWFSF